MLHQESEIPTLKAWMNSDRFKHTKRGYTAESVWDLQPSVASSFASSLLSHKLYRLLRDHQKNSTASTTFGALDAVQVTQMADFVDTIYVSGWQCAATASTSNEPGPDLADYPYDTVPNKVEQLFKAQEFHDRKQRLARSKLSKQEAAANPATDFFRPMIADADTGHGGLTAVMKLTKMFIERGVAGIHLEDQKAGTKKCGHLGGKVLVSTQEHIDRLVAARLQADIMRSELVLVARTDAESARFLDNNSDPRDQPFIIGKLNSALLKEKDIACTFPEAARRLLAAAGKAEMYNRADYVCSLEEAKQKLRQRLEGVEYTFDWEKCRTREGYYLCDGGVEFAAQRAIAFAPYADLLWMETATPDYKEAKHFADTVLSVYPQQMLAYNLSPSFNWDAAKMTDEEIRTYTARLAQLGFCWQFITLAGFHVDGLGITSFARAYAKDKMLGYVQLVQRKERAEKVSTLTHQQWSGVEVVDRAIDLITGGTASTKATADGFTETQFGNGNGHSHSGACDSAVSNGTHVVLKPAAACSAV